LMRAEENGAEVMDPQRAEEEISTVVARIKASIAEAKKLETDTFKIVESTDAGNQIVTDDNFRRLSSDGVMTSSIRANLSIHNYPAPGSNDEFVLYALTAADSGDNSGTDDINTHVAGELDGCFWTGGTKADGTAFTSEDYVENAAGDRYRIFPCNSQSLTSRRYQFMLMRED
ncbi:hypothetical protein LCGC14_2100150, partial [marine sediment metagenome]